MGARFVPRAIGLVVLLFLVTGCQSAQVGLGSRLIAHVAMIDFSGLEKSAPIKDLKVQAAIPQGWEAVPPQNTALFVHYQWRSSARTTGIGVAYIHMPLPMSAKTLLWFAKAKYSGKSASNNSDVANSTGTNSDGRLLGEWTDMIGREWFEAENSKYHVKGYAVASGFDAWVVYTGYRLRGTPNPAEIGLAARAMDSVVPLAMMKPVDPK